MKLRTITGIAASAAALTLAGCASVPATTSPSVSASLRPSASAHATKAAAPGPAPSPNGTYHGACDYNLGSNPVSGTAVATGDVQVSNTGNIGTHLHVKITWPQQGYAPLAASKDIRLKPGGSKDVQFHLPLTQGQLSNLQNWQTGHNYADGCTYKATITGTFGSAR